MRNRIQYIHRFCFVIVAAFLAIFSTFQTQAQTSRATVDYGLAFTSHEATKDQRTSLNLNPDEPFRIEQDFELAFDVAYQRLNNAFGYIFRIIANDSLNIDLVSSPEHLEFDDLNLIVNNSPVQARYTFDEIKLEPSRWNRVVLSVSFTTNVISVSWNGLKKSVPFATSQLRTFRFLFGANDFGKFNTSDVPPITLKNVEIIVKNNSWLKWELKRHDNNDVYDIRNQQLAVARNPGWLIDRHATWVHRNKLTVGKYPSVAFDSNTGKIYISDAGALSVLDFKTGEIQKWKTQGGTVIHTDANQLLFVEEMGKLYNYNVATNKTSAYDFGTHRWENQDTTYTEPSHWHNNKFFNPVDSTLYSFGGYGYYSYQDKFYRFDKDMGRWNAVKTVGSIPPRYLSALGLNAAKDQAFIFGGYGSRSGKQEMSPHSFYDFHSFDLRSHKVTKVWEEPTTESSSNFVFSNSLVVNEKDSCFYVLAYPKDKYKSHMKLLSYSLTKPVRKELGDSIQFLFHDVHSFSDVFYSRATEELVAVTSHKEGDQYVMQVYSINYPPLGPDDIVQHVPAERHITKELIAGTLIALIAIGLTVYGALRFIRKKKKLIPIPQPVVPPSPEVVHVVPVLPITEEKNSMVHLFGGFQVVDKSGNDITHKFTATLKELFIFILVHSVKFEKGVSTTVLHEVFWPDKDEVSARNNRNVNLKKLRNLLQEVGDIGIENTNSYVRLILDKSVLCDYQTTYHILQHGTLDRQAVEVLLRYVRKGNLLPNIQANWIDPFKSEISNKVIDVLLAHSGELDMDRDDKVLLSIADSIFNYDPINQEAMVLKCSVLNKKGKHSLAKDWYDHFAKEYRTLYGENYSKTFEEVVSATIPYSAYSKLG
jgi:DNA-binding SARP family transcriptional activator